MQKEHQLGCQRKRERKKWGILCDQIFFMNNEIIQSGLLLIQTISQTEVSLIQQP